ncbi:Ig-like domain-containing protein [Nocardioides ultimimeridianus]
MRIARYVAAAALALATVAATVSPALASTPQIAISTGPLAPDASVSVLGAGCPSSSPVSLDVWNTADPSSHHHLEGLITANSGGSFFYSYDLDNQFAPGAQIGVYMSCTPTVDWNWDPASEAAREKYVLTTDPNPHVAIEAVSTSAYGPSVQVVAATEVANGAITLTVDGADVPVDLIDENGDMGTDVSHVGWWLFHLPAHLAVGTHSLHASWTPNAPGASTVTADKTLRVTKIRPTLGLRLSPSTILSGNTTAARVTLSHTGAAPRTGAVVLKKNGTIIARGTLRAADNGVRIFAVRIRAVGTYRLTAVFLGSSTLTRATSPVRTLTVHR